MILTIIIPVYNEKNTILTILQKVEKTCIGDVKKDIIIVDDGSTDGTKELLRSIKNKKIKILYKNKNCGKGAAIRIGLKYAQGDIILIQDADLEYDPDDYLKLITPLIEKKSQIVYGVRIFTDKFSTIYFGRRILTLVANFLYKSNLKDIGTCYKVFDATLFQSLNLKCKRFEFCSEVTAKLIKRKVTITEIPVLYRPRTKKQGKKISWWDGIRDLWTLLKYKFID